MTRSASYSERNETNNTTGEGRDTEGMFMANSIMAHDTQTYGASGRQPGNAAGAGRSGGSQAPDPKGFHWRFRDVGKVSPVLTWSELRSLANAGVVTDQHLLILVESNMTMPVGAFATLKAGHGAVAVVLAPASGKLVCRACERELELREYRESTSHPGSYTAACTTCVDRHRQDRDKAVEMLPMSLRQMVLMQTAVTGTPRRGLRGLMDAGDHATWETRSEIDGGREDAAEVTVADDGGFGSDAERDKVATMMMFPHAEQAVDSAIPARRGWIVPVLCVLGGAALAVGVMLLLKRI